MRGKTRLYLKDRDGERRTRRKFLIIPRSLGCKEWRWLEFADIVEEVTAVDVGGSDEWDNYSYEWVEIAFADVQEKDKHTLQLKEHYGA